MKSTVEQLSPTRVKINVEVPFDELKPNFDRAYRKIAQQVHIPGFRPGKVPARVLESRIGRAPVLDEVVSDAVPAKYLEAVRAGEVRALGQPDFEVTRVEDREVLEFTAEVDVRPELTLPDYGSISVSVDDVEVTDEEVHKELENVRARFGTLKGVERPAERGDFLSIDVSAIVDGKEVEEAASSALAYEIGSGELVEGIDEALTGATVGETRTFTTKLVASEYAGQDAEVAVTVRSVKERELPEPDDEFAALASKFDTMEEFTADLREQLAKVKKVQQSVQARDRILEALLEAVEVPLPEKVVEADAAERKHEVIHSLDHNEETLVKLLEFQGKTIEEFDSELKAQSEKAVRSQLLLDAIAEAEQTKVHDSDLTEQVLYHAQRFGISPDEYVRRAQDSGQLTAMYADIRRTKALASVARRATVTSASGAEVDLDELFGPTEAVEAANAEAANAEAANAEAASAEAGNAEGTANAEAGNAENAENTANVETDVTAGAAGQLEK